MGDLNAKLTAEFIGTFALVFIGAGAVVVEGHTGLSHMGIPDGKVGLLGIAVAHGMILAAMIYAFGSSSGANFNPAVSMAAWLRRKIDSQELMTYCAAQLAGALVAAGVLAIIFPDEIELAGLGTPTLGPRISGLQGVGIEAVITFLLTTSILFVTREDNDAKQFGGIAIGGTLTALILFAGPLTGAAANPARYLAPAIFSGNLGNIAIYVVGPLCGAGAAAFLFGVWADRPLEEEGEAPMLDDPDPNGVPSGGRSSRGARGAGRRIEVTIRHARELLSRGSPEAAAELLAPLLPHIHEHEPTLGDRLRTLALIIDDEHGPLPSLEPHRPLFSARGRDPVAGHPAPAQ
jgi:aquaporin Z